MKDAQTVVTALNAGLAQLNAVTTALDKRDYAEAEAALGRAREESARSDAPLNQLASGHRGEQFTAIYNTAEQMKRTRDEVLDLADKMIKQARLHNIEAYNESMERFQRLSAEFDQNRKTINKLLAGM
jgi:hypothetical protein